MSASWGANGLTPASRSGSLDPLMNTAKKKKGPLLFVDTNVLLDFYRANNDAGVALLAKLDGLHDCIITTCQVEMEFKNRQGVINDAFGLLKEPDFNLAAPAFLSEAKTVKLIKERIQDIRNRVKKLRQRVSATLEKPKSHDRICQTCQRLFSNPSALNLKRDSKEFPRMRRLAIRRFFEGQPPRKKNDTSMGDAINWEWIVHRVSTTNRDVVIVSRDGDYGLVRKEKCYVNNFLLEELRERVNQRRNLVVDRLSLGLNAISVPVSAKEIAAEAAMIPAPGRMHGRDFVRFLRGLPEEDRASHIEDLIAETDHEIMNDDIICGLMAETNACDWDCSGWELLRTEFASGKCFATLSFSLSGEQDEDKPFSGTSIKGVCVAKISDDRSIDYEITEASVRDKRE